MIRIGIDTSVLVGILDPKDKWHTTAIDLLKALQKRQAYVAIFDCVLAETVSTVARRMQEQRRPAEFMQTVTRISAEYPREKILWIMPDVPEYYGEILSLLQVSRGELNFNDALIALSCRDRDIPYIPYIASFDRDFDQLSWLNRIATSKELDSIPLE